MSLKCLPLSKNFRIIPYNFLFKSTYSKSDIITLIYHQLITYESKHLKISIEGYYAQLCVLKLSQLHLLNGGQEKFQGFFQLRN